jgi:hypothetical protein
MKFKVSLVTDELNSRFRYSRGGPRGHSRAPDDAGCAGADATPIAEASPHQGRDTAEAVTGALDVSVPMNLPDGRSICPSECIAQNDSLSPLAWQTRPYGAVERARAKLQVLTISLFKLNVFA